MPSLIDVAPFMPGILGNYFSWKPSLKVLECHLRKNFLELGQIFVGTNSISGYLIAWLKWELQLSLSYI